MTAHSHSHLAGPRWPAASIADERSIHREYTQIAPTWGSQDAGRGEQGADFAAHTSHRPDRRARWPQDPRHDAHPAASGAETASEAAGGLTNHGEGAQREDHHADR